MGTGETGEGGGAYRDDEIAEEASPAKRRETR